MSKSIVISANQCNPTAITSAFLAYRRKTKITTVGYIQRVTVHLRQEDTSQIVIKPNLTAQSGINMSRLLKASNICAYLEEWS